MESDKWFDPQVKMGWHKNDGQKKRRTAALRAHNGDKLATARALGALANVSKDRDTVLCARQDSEYFYAQHSKELRRERRSYRPNRVFPLPR